MSLGGLHQALTLDDPLAVVGELALSQERLEHRRLRLLELQEQRIGLVAAGQEHDPRPRADAADADDLARRVRRSGSARAAGGGRRQRAPVGADTPARTPRSGPVRRRRPSSSIGTMSGGSLDDARLAVHHLRELANACRLSFDCALATLRSKRFRRLRVPCRPPAAAISSTSIRAYQRSRFGMPARPRIASRYDTGHGQDDRPPLLRVEAAVAAGDGQAGREPLDVPFEGPGQGLVEVVDAEDESPIGCGEDAEVGQVRITAELHVQPGPGASARSAAIG